MHRYRAPLEATMRQPGKLIGLIVGILLMLPNAYAQTADHAKPEPLNLHIKVGPEPAKAPEVGNLAIEGYSPVSYFEKNLPEKGKPEFQGTYQGKVYYLASEIGKAHV